MQTKINSKSKNQKTTVPLWVLRRLAERAVRVVERHRSKHAAIEAYVDSLVPVAERYVAEYDRSRTTGPGRVKETAEAKAAADALRQVVITWGAHLQRDMPGIDLAVFRNYSSPPDDLIAAAARLMEAVAAHVETAESPVSYAEPMTAEIEAAQAKAIKERDEAQDLLAQLQEQAARVRESGKELQAGLVSLRKTLRATLGPSHRDCVKLRLAQAKVEERDEDDGDAPIGAPNTAGEGPQSAAESLETQVIEVDEPAEEASDGSAELEAAS